ncbi:MAG: rRNA pseudouridine synthase [Clostridia bacterium]|nr:rRNA pseudouridine synthase [Clostridia bacterium]
MEEIRLQKYLSEQGVLSRRAAEEEIRKGKIKVNGVVAEIGMKIDPTRDKVEYGGRRVGAESGRNVRKVYIMLNKPVGYVTTMSDELGRRCVAELVQDVGVRVYPIGRLDLESEGLLLFTNDGALANRLMHPRYHKPKVYHVKIRGEVEAEKVTRLSRPMVIDGYETKPAEVSIVTRKQEFTVLSVTLHEGRNRQIRKMCEQLDLHILTLKRISIGDVKLGNLPIGAWRHLTRAQVESLKN